MTRDLSQEEFLSMIKNVRKEVNRGEFSKKRLL